MYINLHIVPNINLSIVECCSQYKNVYNFQYKKYVHDSQY